MLADLSAIEDIYQGMGNIALNYGKHFKETYRRATAEYDLTLLVPKEYFGQFGNEVRYLSSSNWLRCHCRYFFPKFDIWRNLHHTSRFKPYDKSTIYIYTIHDFNCLMLEYEGTQKKVDQSYRRMMRHLTKANIIVTISNFVASQLEQFFDVRGKRVEMIYNGVEKIVDNSASKPCSSNDIKSPFFLSISACRPSKNFHILLDMMKLMPDKNLYLVGNDDTEYGRMLRQRIEEEAITNVHLTGKVSEEEKVWQLRSFPIPVVVRGVRAARNRSDAVWQTSVFVVADKPGRNRRQLCLFLGHTRTAGNEEAHRRKIDKVLRKPTIRRRREEICRHILV